MILKKLVYKIRTYIFYSAKLRNSCRLYDNVPKDTAAQQAADCIIILHIKMRFTCWINKATDTHSDYVILIYFS